MKNPSNLFTAFEIAKELEVPLVRVNHVLRTQTDIQATGLAGEVQLFDKEALRRIQTAVSRLSGRVILGLARGIASEEVER